MIFTTLLLAAGMMVIGALGAVACHLLGAANRIRRLFVGLYILGSIIMGLFPGIYDKWNSAAAIWGIAALPLGLYLHVRYRHMRSMHQ